MEESADKILIVHYGELWLRGRNRGIYIRKLRKNIAAKLKDEKFKFEKSYDRVLLRFPHGRDEESIMGKISKVFGVSAYEFAYRTEPDMKHIAQLSTKLLKEWKGKKVKIDAHRAYKQHKFDSRDITKKLIQVCADVGAEPELKENDETLSITVTKEDAFIFTKRGRGAGGLPIGTSGKAVILLSGGIDSPVAAWYAMKRGLDPIYVHVHGFSENNEALDSKIPKIIDILSDYSVVHKTFYVPSHVFQMSALNSGKYELTLMKAFMLRLAQRVAEREGADCIVTGESLGQVASQTSSNIAAEQNGIEIPIHRPLIGFDKVEITNIAKAIGTYEESLKPYRDVCSINSRNPATRTKLGIIKDLAKKSKLDSVVTRSLKLARVTESA